MPGSDWWFGILDASSRTQPCTGWLPRKPNPTDSKPAVSQSTSHCVNDPIRRRWQDIVRPWLQWEVFAVAISAWLGKFMFNILKPIQIL